MKRVEIEQVGDNIVEALYRDNVLIERDICGQFPGRVKDPEFPWFFSAGIRIELNWRIK